MPIRPLIARTAPALLAAAAALALAGCASGPLRVNTDVQAFAAPAGTTAASVQWQGARYRFDVLPSQAQRDLAPLQAMTQAALTQHGLVRDDANARYAVQVSASLNTAWVDDWGPYPPYGPWGSSWRFGLGYGYPGWGWGLGWSNHLPTSTYMRELRIAILDLQNGRTLYETRARNESPSGQNDAIFSAMVGAALKDFPHAPAGWQRVTAELQPVPAASVPAR